MRIPLLLLMMLLPWHVMAQSTPAQSRDPGQTLEAFHAAIGSGDAAVARSLLAADAVILESGETETVDQYFSHHFGIDGEFARAVARTDVESRVEVRGDSAWINATSIMKGNFRGKTVNSSNAESAILVRTDGQWRIHAVHWSSHAITR